MKIGQGMNIIKKGWVQKPKGFRVSIIDRGMVLTGGGALLREIDTLFTRQSGVPAYVADNPLACTALGAGKALDELPILQRTLPDM